ncbi:hypothetical protein VNO77_41412 [Canavalia gladiata]|uniref:Uncharacterized protein n=1 Tax=Canavalia gladiata TaxID=3824 RepID=A0AAN9K1P2_CANGL
MDVNGKAAGDPSRKHSRKLALLEGKEDSEDGLRVGCLPSFPFSPLSPLSSAKTLSRHHTNSFSIRMSAEIPDRKTVSYGIGRQVEQRREKGLLNREGRRENKVEL